MALLFLPIKVVLTLLIMIAFTLSMFLVTLGHDFDKGPIRSRGRKRCLDIWTTIIPSIFAAMFCIRLRKKYHGDIEYEEYLGNEEDTEIGAKESA